MSSLLPRDPGEEIAKEVATDLSHLLRLIPSGYKSARSWIARHKDARKTENKVYLQPVYARIDVPAPDRATIDFMLWVSNFSKRSLEPDRLELSGIVVGGRGLQRSSDMRRVQGEISPRAVSNLWFTIDISGSEVRELVLGINKTNNSRSSPQTSIRLYGQILFIAGSDRFRKSVDFQWDWATSNVASSATESLP
ncbi:MAG TPA: hypothetical protein VFP26_10540 [Gemmatimonadaceae bacterium]|nr:hypothetical protein [Gemmatimonadaceae bacterium]